MLPVPLRGIEVAADTGDRVRLHVLPEGDAMLVEDVSRLVRERGWKLEELRVERGQLDEVFRRVTVGEGASE